jgi:hypothetical protein
VETPGALGGLVDDPATKVVPSGYELASDFLGGCTAKRKHCKAKKKQKK